jgi:hypothetical protein
MTLLFYTLHLAAHDLVFGSPAGSGVEVTYPDGHVERHGFAARGRLTLRSLARGQYQVRVVGASGLSPRVPVALSRGQALQLKVIGLFDIALVLLVLGAIAMSLLLVRRPRLRARLRPRIPRIAS